MYFCLNINHLLVMFYHFHCIISSIPHDTHDEFNCVFLCCYSLFSHHYNGAPAVCSQPRGDRGVGVRFSRWRIQPVWLPSSLDKDPTSWGHPGQHHEQFEPTFRRHRPLRCVFFSHTAKIPTGTHHRRYFTLHVCPHFNPCNTAIWV